jgi:hypothetical protein
MTNKVRIFAHPDLDTAIAGEAKNGHFEPIEIGAVPNMTIAMIRVLTWICLKRFAGNGNAPYSNNTPTKLVNIWEVVHPSGERWFIAATKKLRVPITQEVNG